MGHLHNAFGDSVGQRRDPVHHDKGIADERGLDRCGPAGYYRGAGMKKGSAGVAYKSDARWVLRQHIVA